MLDSLWAKQTPNRAKELSKTLSEINEQKRYRLSINTFRILEKIYYQGYRRINPKGELT